MQKAESQPSEALFSGLASAPRKSSVAALLILCSFLLPLSADTPPERPGLRGKVLCGYQGWFRCPDDGSGLGWVHWGNGRITSTTMTVDMWPDMSEYSDEERYATPYTYPNGEPAHLFSSHNRRTVLRHFEWMRDYGVDGVVFQQFAVGLPGAPVGHVFESHREVLGYVREAARETGRAWAMSYDLAAMPAEGAFEAVAKDWKRIVDGGMTQDANYVYEDGKPVVVVWGFYDVLENVTLEVANNLVDFFQADGPYRSFMIAGGDWTWRNETNAGWKACRERLDGYIPWNVGNFSCDDDHTKWPSTNYWPEDVKMARGKGILYMPVAYPGFTWDNLTHAEPGTSLIPRLKGRFLWKSFHDATQLGVDSIFVAMFDEVDEGTAIFKVTDSPPTQAHFVGMEGMPSDWYLRLVGVGAKMFRGEIPLSAEIPIR
jgi:hypothetical protein